MKPKPQEKNKRTTNHPTQHHWDEMNRKQRREMTRKIQSEDLSLEVIHPDAAGMISATKPTTWLYPRAGTANRYGASGAPQQS
jgi:hypothetical protein